MNSRITSASCRRLRPLLDELEQFLRTRQRGITALQCRFHHYRAAPTSCTLRLAASRGERRTAAVIAARAARQSRVARARAALRTARRRAQRASAREFSRCGRPASAATRPRARCRRSSSICARASAWTRCTACAACRNTGPRMRWRVAEPVLAHARASDAKAAADMPLPAPFRRPLWLLHAPQELDSQRGRPRHGGALSC